VATERHTGKYICAWTIRFALLLSLSGCGGGGGGGTSSACSGPLGSGLPLSITGHLQYEDRAYDKDGFTGTISVKPIRFATVQVVRSCDNSTVLNSSDSVSDGNGDYTVTFTNSGAAGVYVRVLAAAPSRQIIIQKPPNALWAITSETDPVDDGGPGPFTTDLTATTVGGGGVFNLLDVMTSAAEFVDGLTGGSLPPLAVNWFPGSCDGTYFDSSTDSIFVLGGCNDGDTDEYDDPVVAHEFGHFVSSVYSRDDSPGGQHFLNDNTQDIRLAWSEGWGDFFSSAARNDPLYVDTIGTGSTAAANLSFNLEDLSTVMNGINLETDSVYTTNEISVAAVLWDILDASPAETFTNTAGTDAVSAGMAPIWDVIANYLTCSACGITNVSFEDFWDGWFSLGYGLQAEMETVVADRKMALASDGFEPDDSPATAVPITVGGGAQTHTLYPAGDLDFVSFPATGGTQYTIKTSGLTNGADTLLEVFESDGTTLITSNDDAAPVTGKSSTCGVNLVTQASTCPPNDDLTLSSKVIFTPTADGTYYVRVKRSPTSPPSAGLFGSYNLKITSP